MNEQKEIIWHTFHTENRMYKDSEVKYTWNTLRSTGSRNFPEG